MVQDVYAVGVSVEHCVEFWKKKQTSEKLIKVPSSAAAGSNTRCRSLIIDEFSTGCTSVHVRVSQIFHMRLRVFDDFWTLDLLGRVFLQTSSLGKQLRTLKTSNETALSFVERADIFQA